MKLKSKFNIILACIIIILVASTFFGSNPLTGGLICERQQIYFLVVAIAAGILSYWVRKNMIIPLEKLQEATHKIADGNLDFEIVNYGSDEIGKLCQDFDEMRKRIKENIDARIVADRNNRELITNISHDLKTPMTTIRGYVEGIVDGVADSPEKMDRYIKTIYNKVNEMDALINELTMYSKIDLNYIPYDFSVISAKHYFDDCAEELFFELEEEGIGFTYYNEIPRDVYVLLDNEQLRRVINNIISNAIKHMDKKTPQVTLRVKAVGEYVQVEVSDNGTGIAEKDLPHIFERLYRADASRNSYRGGSGIGLSIANRIVSEHGGKIWAVSEVGKGTSLFFTIQKYREV